jgi:hypothetical protein
MPTEPPHPAKPPYLKCNKRNIAERGISSSPICVQNNMDRIEFDTTIEREGVIRIPANLTNGLRNGETVHVTLSSGMRRTRLVERMINHPVVVDEFTPLTREEIYDRRV